MKAVTGNRLTDGAVVYLSDDDLWVETFSDAARFQGDDALAVLAAAQSRTGEIADAYLIDVDDAGAIDGRAKIRETIRTAGPTVRADLGYQAVRR